MLGQDLVTRVLRDGHDLVAVDRDAIDITDPASVAQIVRDVDVADLIVRLIDEKAPTGVYHGTSSGQTSWHAFAREIMASIGKDPGIVEETTAASFNQPAPRPHYSVLGHDALERIGVTPIGNWKERWAVACETVLGRRQAPAAE